MVMEAKVGRIYILEYIAKSGLARDLEFGKIFDFSKNGVRHMTGPMVTIDPAYHRHCTIRCFVDKKEL